MPQHLVGFLVLVLFIWLSYCLKRVSHLCQAGLDHSPPTYSSHIAGMTGACHHTQLLLVVMWSHKLFAWAGLRVWSFQSLPPE
jgi:hypothetical protein